MKLLFINSKQFDYLQDLTFSGLVHLLGASNVVDYPWNYKYHLPVKNYPKNLGYTGFSLKPFIKPDFNSFDAVILGSAKKDALDTLNNILSKVHGKPIVFLDGGDKEEIGGDFFRLGAGDDYLEFIKKRPFDLICKREFFPDLHGNLKNVYPFPFSFHYHINIESLTEEEKSYDISFWAQQKPAVREKALNLLKGKFDCDENGTSVGLDFKKYKRKGLFYLKELSRCKMVLNLRGGGWDTMRYWEVSAVGRFMISQRPQIVIPNNFEEGKHVEFCDDTLDDMLDKMTYYLSNVSLREEMTKNAKAHLMKYHLNTNRAKYLIDIIKKIL
ncbi:MAG: glycosyltransferase family 1 protein [Ferruginibacter sp.]|nr:glycosyltransferase family 1 protein [Ferruginibacter sp.]